MHAAFRRGQRSLQLARSSDNMNGPAFWQTSLLHGHQDLDLPRLNIASGIILYFNAIVAFRASFHCFLWVCTHILFLVCDIVPSDLDNAAEDRAFSIHMFLQVNGAGEMLELQRYSEGPL